MPNGEEYLLRPVMKGMCKYESLKDKTLNLFDISLMNDALDVQDENEYRLYEANK